jgi:hypothetical protein
VSAPIDRRTFLKTAVAGAVATAAPFPSARADETLYNGIVLPRVWPPTLQYPLEATIAPPYIAEPPAVIPIDLGRQLFVDDFLIERTSLTRTFHLAQYDPASPVLRPETPWERRDEYAERSNRPQSPTAMVFSDGVFFDPEDRLFKMWYMSGYRMRTSLVVSRDGVSWERRRYDVAEGTNIVRTQGRDSCTVWLDHFAEERSARFKMAYFEDHSLILCTSPDGIHWTRIGETGPAGDRSTFFYNPFRRVWVFSLRQAEANDRARHRRYWENARFEAANAWSATTPVAWVKADARDPTRPGFAQIPELYNLDCAAYESVLLGLFSVWRGESSTREKINEVTVGFSRDGFHWTRLDRRSFFPVADQPGAWNYANVQSAGGCCLIVGDHLRFYMSGRSGIPGTNEPGTCSTGLALLRRDGFASMDWLPEQRSPRRVLGDDGDGGVLLTRPLRFSGSHLFVNADLTDGELRAEVLDMEGRTLPDFAGARCSPAHGDGTKMEITWAGVSLATIANRAVRLRFRITRGRLYAFWVSAHETGESGGYVAAGGPAFVGAADVRSRG